MKLTLTFLAVAIASLGFSQTAQQVLLNSSRYHDPEQKWQQTYFSGQISTSLSPVMEQQIGQKEVITEIEISNAKGNFSVRTTIKDDNIQVSYSENDCEILVNNKPEMGEDMIKKHMAMINLTNCETARPAINYHIYLMGLPMKLILDDAEIIESKESVDFFGTDRYSISVDYPDNTWIFYFDKSTYSLKGCEFKFKVNNFGEKIVLEDEVEVGGMKMFGKRTWYALDGKTWLATDSIQFD